jgi:hypothetical protein
MCGGMLAIGTDAAAPNPSFGLIQSLVNPHQETCRLRFPVVSESRAGRRRPWRSCTARESTRRCEVSARASTSYHPKRVHPPANGKLVADDEPHRRRIACPSCPEGALSDDA